MAECVLVLYMDWCFEIKKMKKALCFVYCLWVCMWILYYFWEDEEVMDGRVRFFTLVCSNSSFYLEQTRLLKRSMTRFVPEAVLHLLVTADVDRAKVEGDVVHVVEAYANEPRRPHPNDTWISALHASWVHQLTKIRLWSFYNESAYVCYMDGDVAFFGKVFFLFSCAI